MIRASQCRALFLSVGLASSALILGGCQMGSMALSAAGLADSPSSPPAAALGGWVHGGQQPVTGSVVQLYAAGTTGPVTDTSANANGPFVYATRSTACGGIGDIAEFNDTIGGTAANAVFASSTATCTSPASTSAISATTGTPIGMAVDKNDNLWLANGVAAAGSVTYLVTGGDGTIGSTSTSSVSFAQTSLLVPYNIAVDGNNNAWVINASGSAFNELSVSTSSGSPVIAPLTGTTGLIHADVSASKLNTPRQGAIDSSGNLWITNSQSGNLAYVSAIVGVAAPVVTPLSVALKNNRVGQKPWSLFSGRVSRNLPGTFFTIVCQHRIAPSRKTCS